MKLKSWMGQPVIALLVYLGFSSIDLAFCRWFIYIYQGLIVGITAILFLGIPFISKFTKVQNLDIESSFKKTNLFLVAEGMLFTSGMLYFIYTTPHTTAFNILTFISILFYISFFVFKYKLKEVLNDN